MTDKYILNSDEVEDLEYLIIMLDKKYNIYIDANDLLYVQSFDDLIDAIIAKVRFTDTGGCTSQQAFYKLRNIFVELGLSDRDSFSTNANLKDILPKRSRITLIKEIERRLGFKLHVLSFPDYLQLIFALMFLSGFISLFITWQIGIAIILFSCFSIFLLKQLRNSLVCETVRELTESVVRENYPYVRSESGTMNKLELKSVLLDYFAMNMGMDRNVLRQSIF